jgi:hypothetical protein
MKVVWLWVVLVVGIGISLCLVMIVFVVICWLWRMMIWIVIIRLMGDKITMCFDGYLCNIWEKPGLGVKTVGYIHFYRFLPLPSSQKKQQLSGGVLA